MKPDPTNAQWLSTLRHDLRTPINHILGYSELFDEELADQGIQNRADLTKIREAARNMLQILEGGGDGALIASQAEKSNVPAEEKQIPSCKPGALTGRILVVDDNSGNRETLIRRLHKQGHTTVEARNGRKALEIIRADKSLDLILMDILMPEMDGYQALIQLKTDPESRHLPVIMISALDEMERVIQCIEAGAEDYLPKPFDPTLLRARIGASLEKKALRDAEHAHLQKIEETQVRLVGELKQASSYVASMLPKPEDDPLKIRWRFETSTELGGDAFGYHRLDGFTYAIFLLDVCGHGVGAALLSVSAMNVLRSGSLPGADFHSPSSVLSALDAAFPMEKHNNMYFTIWYGVYDFRTGTLKHASGGHPPALLLSGTQPPQEIHSPGRIIGVFPGGIFPEQECKIPSGSRLLIFSDGAYELRKPDGDMLAFEDFKQWVSVHGREPDLPDLIAGMARTVTGREELADDLSLLCIDFPDGSKAIDAP